MKTIATVLMVLLVVAAGFGQSTNIILPAGTHVITNSFRTARVFNTNNVAPITAELWETTNGYYPSTNHNLFRVVDTASEPIQSHSSIQQREARRWRREIPAQDGRDYMPPGRFTNGFLLILSGPARLILTNAHTISP
jgi:hypothetical protein